VVAKRPQASSFADAYKGGRLKIIGANAQRPPHFIIVQPEIKYSGSGSAQKLMPCMSRTNGQSNSVLRLDLLNSPDHTV
jgi:hypothetical protein